MDQEWKNQNQNLEDGNLSNSTSGLGPADAASSQTAPSQQNIPVDNTTVTPAAPVSGSTFTPAAPSPPGQPHGLSRPANHPPITSEEFYSAPAQNPVSPARKIVVMITVFALLVIPGVTGAYFIFGKDKSGDKQASQSPAQPVEQNSDEKESIKVPEDWQSIDTKLTFTVKAPNGWTITEASESTANNIVSKSADLIDPNTTDSSLKISLGTQSLSDSTSKEDYDQAIKSLLQGEEALTSLAIEEERSNSEFSTTNINGKEWTRIDRHAPTEENTVIYLWVNDHAVVLVASAKDKTSLDKAVKEYLLPIATSIKTN